MEQTSEVKKIQMDAAMEVLKGMADEDWASILHAAVSQLQRENDALREAVELLRLCQPEGMCATNPNVPDERVVALDVPYGDLRVIAEFLDRIGSAATPPEQTEAEHG